MSVKREGATSIGGLLLAVLASQHHNLHMILLAFGLGGAGMTFVQAYPGIRRVMLLLSLGMVALNLLSLRRRQMTVAMRVMVGFFTLLTLALVVWSFTRFGF